MKNYLFLTFALSLVLLSGYAAERQKFIEIQTPDEFHELNSKDNRIIYIIYKAEQSLLSNLTKTIEGISNEFLEVHPDIKLYRVNYNLFDEKNPLDYLRPVNYPGVALFEGGREWFYKDALTPSSLLKWILNILNRKITMLKTQAEFEEFLDRDSYAKVLALYNKDMKEEVQILQDFNDQNLFAECKILNIGLCLEDCLFNHRGLNFTSTELIMLNPQSYEFPIAYFSARSFKDVESLKTFFYIESFPDVINIDTSYISQYFAGYTKYTTFLVLERGGSKQEKNKMFHEIFTRSAVHNKRHDLFYDRFLHGVVYYDEEWASFAEIFSLHKQTIEPPMVFATVFDREKLLKYRMDFKNAVFNFENFRKFLEDAKNKGLQAMLRSEPAPVEEPNTHQDVEILVGENFREKVIASSENFIVLFYDDMEEPGQIYTRKMFEYMAQKMRAKTALRKGKDGIFRNEKHLRFGVMNLKKNEVVDYAPKGAPEIALWPRNFKNEPELFFMPVTLRSLAAWINSIAAECEIELDTQEEYSFIKSSLNDQEQEMYDKTQMEFMGEKELLKKLEEDRQKKKAKYESENPKSPVEEKPKPIPLGASVPDARKIDNEL